MKKLIRHIRRWNIWRKRNMNGPVYHLFVLFGIVKSPTYAMILLPEEKNQMWEEINAVFNKNN